MWVRFLLLSTRLQNRWDVGKTIEMRYFVLNRFDRRVCSLFFAVETLESNCSSVFDAVRAHLSVVQRPIVVVRRRSCVSRVAHALVFV